MFFDMTDTISSCFCSSTSSAQFTVQCRLQAVYVTDYVSMAIISNSSSDSYIFTDVNQVESIETIFLDITDLDAVRQLVVDNKIDVIVNCAAYTNVDAAETNEELAEKLRITKEEVYRKNV